MAIVPPGKGETKFTIEVVKEDAYITFDPNNLSSVLVTAPGGRNLAFT